ncbi:hypothetical protein QCL51_07160 [Pseudomonas sp. LTR0]|uniref:hypothetical protein n=1 Tax=Pseudomonas sp. LTR0 TaxID=3040601 RepID=UPI0030D3484A
MKTPNTYRWQQERIQKRLEIIESALTDIDQRKVKFQQITYLAKYVAEVIRHAEARSLEQIKGHDLKVSITGGCRGSSLLKSKIYRARLDIWMRQHYNNPTPETTEITELRFKLLKLSNEHSITLDELRTLQETHSRRADTNMVTTERNDGMTIAQMILNHFKEFCEIQDGALIEPSPGRPIIVPANLFAAYLKWTSSLY